MLAPTPGMEVCGQFVHLCWVVVRYGGLSTSVTFQPNLSTGSPEMESQSLEGSESGTTTALI